MKICHTCQQTYSDEVAFCPRDGARVTVQSSETEAQLAAGLSSRFRIVRRLDGGGMGTVFLAEQIGVGNRPVALKVLNRNLLDDPEFLRRFRREAGSTGCIRHPNVVTVYESAQADDGTPYIAMEFLDGESLRQALQQRGALPLPEVVEILQQVARGLNAAHKLGIIHRDIKPENIFLTRGDENELIVKLLDFGIAKLREPTDIQRSVLLGTPPYMSFEQASGMGSVDLDLRSDVYSLGVVVYEMLSGRVPFQSDTPIGYLRKHWLEDPPPFRAVAPGLDLPLGVERTVMKALVKDRDQRHATALDFARDLATAAQPSSRVESRAPIPPTPIVRPPAAREPDQIIPVAPMAKGPAKVNPKDGLPYTWIPPGTFMMGCSPEDNDCSYEERPAHPVTLSKGLWMSRTEVTVSAYRRFAAATGRQMPPEPNFSGRLLNPGWRNEAMPSVNVTWDDAQAYCSWAGGRLPTEAEWEYAARAGSTAARYGDLDEIAWYADNSGAQRLDSLRIWSDAQANYPKRLSENGNGIHEVAQKRANGLGLYDMLGNVWEWVSDWYERNYYQNSPPQDPTGPATGQFRVLRGGSWDVNPLYLRASFRAKLDPANWDIYFGFRCVAEVFTP